MSDIKPRITALGSHVPATCVTNDELAAKIDTNDEWIFSHTGIKSRHIADDETATSDLAIAALRKLSKEHNVELDTIDALIVATATQDYLGFPSTACVIQAKLGLPPIAAFDISAGCTGFIYALEIAKALAVSKAYRRIAVVGSEKLTAITDWTDRNTCVLFGDGAGCAFIEMSDTGHEIIDSVLHSEGTGASYLSIPTGGTAYVDESTIEGNPRKIHMDGRAVYNFAVRVMCSVIEELVVRNGCSTDDIDWFVPHQANSRIIAAAAKRLKIDLEKFYINIDQYANTSAASIPIALAEMAQKALLKPGQRIITVGFGAGLTYGGNLLQW